MRHEEETSHPNAHLSSLRRLMVAEKPEETQTVRGMQFPALEYQARAQAGRRAQAQAVEVRTEITMYSYTETLRKACRHLHPSRVLEWGPGMSTRLIHEECPEAYILTIEHDPNYYAKAASEHGDYAEVIHMNVACPKSRYATFPLTDRNGMEFKFDLAFIDGRRRAECAMIAGLVVRRGGLIILHDAHRTAYTFVAQYLKQADGFSLDPMTGVFLPCR